MMSDQLSIAITGPDGSGKSTQIKELQKYFESKGKRVALDDKWDILNVKIFPEYRFLDGCPRDLLRCCIAEMPNDIRALFLYWMMLSSARKSVNCPDVDVVIHDGYWIKHACSEAQYGSDLAVLESISQLFPVPALVIYLDVPAEVTLKRKILQASLTPYECGRDGEMTHINFIIHQRAIRDRMHEVAMKKSWTIIDATQSPDRVWEDIKRSVDKLLIGKR